MLVVDFDFLFLLRQLLLLLVLLNYFAIPVTVWLYLFPDAQILDGNYFCKLFNLVLVDS